MTDLDVNSVPCQMRVRHVSQLAAIVRVDLRGMAYPSRMPVRQDDARKRVLEKPESDESAEPCADVGIQVEFEATEHIVSVTLLEVCGRVGRAVELAVLEYYCCDDSEGVEVGTEPSDPRCIYWRVHEDETSTQDLEDVDCVANK